MSNLPKSPIRSTPVIFLEQPVDNDEKKIKELLEKYLQMFNASQFDALKKITLPETKIESRFFAGAVNIDLLGKLMNNILTLKHMKLSFNNAQIMMSSDNSAKVVGDLLSVFSYTRGKKYTFIYDVIRQDGKWYIKSGYYAPQSNKGI